MANVSVYNMEGNEVGTLELNDAVFGVNVNEHLVHLAVVSQLANKRQGTQKAKTRDVYKRQMAVNTWVDNTYYMDSNGILVTDKWMKFQESGSSEYKWYYFGSSGKAIMDNWSKINNKWYYFDSNGEMQTGWVLDNM